VTEELGLSLCLAGVSLRPLVRDVLIYFKEPHSPLDSNSSLEYIAMDGYRSARAAGWH
jgi:hypothetical protein